MILFELLNTEDSPIYQELEIANGNRQYDFLRSMVIAALKVNRPQLSHCLIQALNYQAICCLHAHAGVYRPCTVTVGDYTPPEPYRVEALMCDFIDSLNRSWFSINDPAVLASFVLWRLNHIHPFINGNGRTARAASYFVLCVSAGGWLPGEPILPELLRRNRTEYVEHLKAADKSLAAGNIDITGLHGLIQRLLQEQLASAGLTPTTGAANAVPAVPDGDGVPAAAPAAQT